MGKQRHRENYFMSGCTEKIQYLVVQGEGICCKGAWLLEKYRKATSTERPTQRRSERLRRT
jgi:hypothetical protein